MRSRWHTVERMWVALCKEARCICNATGWCASRPPRVDEAVASALALDVATTCRPPGCAAS